MRVPLKPAWMKRFARGTESFNAPASLDAPLIAAADIAGLAVQAGLLAHSPVPEVHDHHAGDWSSRWLGRGLDFEESRQYSAGDDIRDMDWRTTARTGRPHLKIYREERQPMVHLVVDRGATMRFGTRRRLKAAQAARVAAVLAFAAAGHNGVIGATFWDVQDETLPARHGRLAALGLIEQAAAPCPPLDHFAPTDSLRYADRLAALEVGLPRGARLVLISDLAWLTDAHERQLARLAARFAVWVIQIVDPAERVLPEVGMACFHDMASGQRAWLDTSNAAARAAADAALAGRLAAQAAHLTRAGARHQLLASEADDLAARLAHG